LVGKKSDFPMLDDGQDGRVIPFSNIYR